LAYGAIKKIVLDLTIWGKVPFGRLSPWF